MDTAAKRLSLALEQVSGNPERSRTIHICCRASFENPDRRLSFPGKLQRPKPVRATQRKAMAKHHWARNELILAPELCFRELFVTGSKTHPEVIKFSTNWPRISPTVTHSGRSPRRRSGIRPGFGRRRRSPSGSPRSPGAEVLGTAASCLTR